MDISVLMLNEQCLFSKLRFVLWGDAKNPLVDSSLVAPAFLQVRLLI